MGLNISQDSILKLESNSHIFWKYGPSLSLHEDPSVHVCDAGRCTAGRCSFLTAGGSTAVRKGRGGPW